MHDDITGILEDCYKYGANRNIEKAKEKSQEVFLKWQEIESHLITFIHHDKLDEITLITAQLSPLISNGEIGQYLAEVRKALILMDYTQTSEQPLIRNIL